MEEISSKELRLTKLEKIIRSHVGVIEAALAYVIVLRVLNITCPIRGIIQIPCPGCGTTRALISLAKFDVKGYFYYNAMALPLLLILFLQFHKEAGFMKKIKIKNMNIIIDVITIIIVVLVIAYYIYRLCFNLIP